MKKVMGIVLAPVVLALSLGSAHDNESPLLNSLKGTSPAKGKGLKRSAAKKESAKDKDTPAIGRRKPILPKGGDKHKARPRLPTLKSAEEAAADNQSFLQNFLSSNIASSALDKDDLLQDFLPEYAKEEKEDKEEAQSMQGKPVTGGYFSQSQTYETPLSRALLKKEKELKTDSATRPQSVLEDSKRAAKNRAAQLSKLGAQLNEIAKNVAEISETLTESVSDKADKTEVAKKASKTERAEAGRKPSKSRGVPRTRKSRSLKSKQTPEPLIA